MCVNCSRGFLRSQSNSLTGRWRCLKREQKKLGWEIWRCCRYTIQNAVHLLTLFSVFLSQCSLSVCPDLDEYESEGSLRLGLAGHHQRSNASLALQLSHTWLQRHFLTGVCFCLCGLAHISFIVSINNCLFLRSCVVISSGVQRCESRSSVPA